MEVRNTETERLYLLVPIDGCCCPMPEKNKALTMAPEPLSFFCEDNGFEFSVFLAVEHLELGQAHPVCDGVAQLQTIVRVK